MAYRQPTYKEYCEATTFAKFRYRYGVYVQLAAVLLFLFIICYAVINIEEMKANPAKYAEKKLGVVCNPPFVLYDNYGSIGNITGIGEGW